jgi:hypothetical protein
VGQSFGAFTATLVADRLAVDVLVLVAGMIPSPGEAPGDWWANTGYPDAVRAQAARDGGKTGNEDPYERLNITPDEIASGHCPALSRPKELAEILEGYARA